MSHDFRIKEIDEDKEEQKEKEEIRFKKQLKDVLKDKKKIKSLSPQLRQVSPKYFHLFSNKIIDSENRFSKIDGEFIILSYL